MSTELSTTTTTPLPEVVCEAWSEWTSCSAHCGEGIKKRKRICDDGREEEESETCTTENCLCSLTLPQLLAALMLVNDQALSLNDFWLEKDGIDGHTRSDEQIKEGMLVQQGCHVSLPCGMCECGTDGSLVCSKNETCNLDCVWAPWGDWTPCSASCGDRVGSRSRNRTIIQPARFNGKPCEPDGFEEVQTCPDPAVPCPCVWSDWSEWTPCDQPCGGLGQMNRTRSKMTNSGPCPDSDSSSQIDFCNEQPCPTEAPPTSTEGSSSTVPTPTCEQGREYFACYNKTCPATCSDLTGSSQCSETDECISGCFCPMGMLVDRDGSCVAPNDCSCDLDSIQCESCSEKVCWNGKAKCNMLPDCDCIWAEWTPWTVCSASCGPGSRSRIRTVLSRLRGKGKNCAGSFMQQDNCQISECPKCKDSDGTEYDRGSNMPSPDACINCYCDHNADIDPCLASDWYVTDPCSAKCDGVNPVAGGLITEKRDLLDKLGIDSSLCILERQVSCNISCRVDCVTLTVDEGPCLSLCPLDDDSCDKTWGPGIMALIPNMTIPAANGGTECFSKYKPCLVAQTPADITCAGPKEMVACSDPCAHSCQDLSLHASGTDTCLSTDQCMEACACSKGTYYQDGQCIAPEDCRCFWNEQILGPMNNQTQVSYLIWFSKKFLASIIEPRALT
ncbi:hypothetical protein Ciccas_002575 [Cichlidogyrus casuarinus]|uniref:TIL domain-containing protein n=1 Tax=Cichlidogyrus casuarinus TaxID=1844966 RepID=A0ABD2QGV4_9PLAT